MQAIYSLLALHADFSFPAPLTFGSKWSVLLSFPCLRKVHKFPPFGGLKASFSPPPLGLAHPIPWKFQPHNSKIHGFISVLAQEVPSTHCFEKLLHGWRHTTIEVIQQHPCIETVMWTCTDGLHEPLPALIEPLIVMGSKHVDLPLQIVGLVSIEEFF